MTTSLWQSLPGTMVGERYRLVDLLEFDANHAVYSATGPDNATVSVELFPGGHLQREKIVAFQHPNVSSVIASGPLGDGEFDYVVSEAAETTLSEYLRAGPMNEEAARDLAHALISGLEHIHAQNLVYLNLRPESVVWAGGVWKLGEPELAQVPGRIDPKTTRASMGKSPYAPPEAFHGIISPAWDIWSFGVLIGNALAPVRVEGERPEALVEPFQTLRNSCLRLEASERIDIEGIRQLMETAPVRVEPIAPMMQPVLPSAPEEPLAAPAFYAAPRSKLPLLLLGLAALAALLFVLWRKPAPEAEQTRARTATTDLPSPVATTLDTPLPARTEQRREAVKTLLDDWVATTKRLDAKAHAALYAPRLTRFYTWRNASRDQVLREKRRVFQQISTVNRYAVSEIRIDSMTPSKATVSFRKEWDFSGKNPFSGAERQALSLAWMEDRWKITEERELKVYSVKRR